MSTSPCWIKNESAAWPRGLHGSRGGALLRAALVALLILLSLAPARSANAAEPAYSTDFVRWRAGAGAFTSWAVQGVVQTSAGTVVLDLDMGASGQSGVVTSPVMPVAAGFTEAIASWNADTPLDTSVEVFIRARVGDHWTGWYSLGVWAAGVAAARHSVAGQRDADGRVATDTLVLSSGPADAFQVSVHLAGGSGPATPTLRNVAVALSNGPYGTAAESTGNPDLWDIDLDVPRCSQMVYPDGGRAWCSPTSTAMVLGYWEGYRGPCEPAVRAAVAGVYDPVYGGHGNWPFNTAYAGALGYDAYVTRLSSLSDIESWIAAGVPVIASLAWQAGELDNASIAWTSGHLLVITGFDAAGNPIVNDPAAARDNLVHRVYPREQFERLWQADTGGTVYLIYPPDWPVPAL